MSTTWGEAPFVMVANLNGLNLSEAVIEAVKEYIERCSSADDFKERAAAALAAIEREAEQRRGAIQALFATDGEASETAHKPRGKQAS